jgi:hypothetical protein
MLKSARRDREITIDGSDADWQGALAYLEESKIAIGVCNDEKDLYLCLVVSDRQMERQIMGSGFTVWFDAGGGKDKKFGIHYPMGRQGRQTSDGRGRDEGDPDERTRLLQEATRDIEIIGPGKDDRFTMTAPGAGGIKAQVARANENLIYELKVPLNHGEGREYVIGADTGKTIGIGFETSQADRAELKNERNRGDNPSDEAPRGGGRGGRRRGGGMPSGGGSPAEPFQFWSRVSLSQRSVP